MGIVSRLWKADWHLSFLLGMLLVSVFVLYPISNRAWIGILLESSLSLMLISGVALVARRPAARVFTTILALGTAAIGWVRLYAPSQRLTVIGVAMWIVFFALLAAVILIRVFHEGRINVHRIQGAVAAYLLLGLIWSGCYRLVMEIDPEAFSPAAVGDEGTLMSRLVYFSFATLTTVGYGDVTAVATAARSLALLEALTGQLFPAVLIARLVSMEVSHPKHQSD